MPPLSIQTPDPAPDHSDSTSIHPAWCSAVHCQVDSSGEQVHRSVPVVCHTTAGDTEITVQRYQHGVDPSVSFRVDLVDLELHGREMTVELTPDDTAMFMSMFGLLSDPHC